MTRLIRTTLSFVWRSNTALFAVSVLAGFVAGSGCILSSERNTHAPDDFRITITSSSRDRSAAGRMTVDAYGRLRYEDWGAPGAREVVLREVLSRARVDSVYAVFRDNSFISLRQHYPKNDGAGYLDADSKVTIEGLMRGTYQVVHVVTSDESALPGSVRNILAWYYGEVGMLRGKVASEGR